MQPEKPQGMQTVFEAYAMREGSPAVGLGRLISGLWGGVRHKPDRSGYPAVTGVLLSVETSRRYSSGKFPNVSENDSPHLAPDEALQLTCVEEQMLAVEIDCPRCASAV